MVFTQCSLNRNYKYDYEEFNNHKSWNGNTDIRFYFSKFIPMK